LTLCTCSLSFNPIHSLRSSISSRHS
jgi:hypothetical protein